jgi:hypothetical protein
MIACLDQLHSRKEFCITIDESTAQGLVIPNWTDLDETRMIVASHFITLALHNQFRICEYRVMDSIINVEMHAYMHINMSRLQAKHNELFYNMLAILYGRHTWKRRKIFGNSTINKNIFTITYLHEVARKRQIRQVTNCNALEKYISTITSLYKRSRWTLITPSQSPILVASYLDNPHFTPELVLPGSIVMI